MARGMAQGLLGGYNALQRRDQLLREQARRDKLTEIELARQRQLQEAITRQRQTRTANMLAVAHGGTLASDLAKYGGQLSELADKPAYVGRVMNNADPSLVGKVIERNQPVDQSKYWTNNIKEYAVTHEGQAPTAPQLLEFLKQKNAQKAPLVKVNTAKPEKSAEDKGRYEATVKEIVGRGEQARALAKTYAEKAQYASMMNGNLTAVLNDKKGIKGGVFAQQTQFFRKLGQFLGLKTDAPLAELIDAQANQIVLLKRNPKSDGGLTGNTSDADIRFLQSLVADMNKTVDGRRLIAEMMFEANTRMINFSKAYEAARAKEGIDFHPIKFATEFWAKQNDDVVKNFRKRAEKIEADLKAKTAKTAPGAKDFQPGASAKGQGIPLDNYFNLLGE